MTTLLAGIECKFVIDGFELHEQGASPEHGYGFRDVAELVLIMKVRDRLTGRHSEVASVEYVSRVHVERMSEMERARYARRLVLKMVVHEVDETLLLHGERVFDPHKEER